jgi:catalase
MSQYFPLAIQVISGTISANEYLSQFEAQIMDEEDQLRFGFDLLDPTKIVPEELVPFTPLGKLTLNRNPRNYFSETEQIMFQPGHIVRGVDFTDDPLLQGRLFSYLDTQINRHGGPNFEQLPINQPRTDRWHNNNRDGAGMLKSLLLSSCTTNVAKDKCTFR